MPKVTVIRLRRYAIEMRPAEVQSGFVVGTSADEAAILFMEVVTPVNYFGVLRVSLDSQRVALYHVTGKAAKGWQLARFA